MHGRAPLKQTLWANSLRHNWRCSVCHISMGANRPSALSIRLQVLFSVSQCPAPNVHLHLQTREKGAEEGKTQPWGVMTRALSWKWSHFLWEFQSGNREMKKIKRFLIFIKIQGGCLYFSLSSVWIALQFLEQRLRVRCAKTKTLEAAAGSTTVQPQI